MTQTENHYVACAASAILLGPINPIPTSNKIKDILSGAFSSLRSFCIEVN